MAEIQPITLEKYEKTLDTLYSLRETHEKNNDILKIIKVDDTISNLIKEVEIIED